MRPARTGGHRLVARVATVGREDAISRSPDCSTHEARREGVSFPSTCASQWSPRHD